MRNFCFLCFLFLFLTTGILHSQIIAWHFDQAKGNEPSSDATIRAGGLTNSTLIRSQSLQYSSFGRAFSSSGFTVNGTKAQALANDDYISFTVQTVPNFAVSLFVLDAKLRRSADGPSHYCWYYSLNGINFLPVGNDISLAFSSDGLVQPRVVLYNTPDLQKIASYFFVVFRLYAWGATSSTGSLAIGRYAEGVTNNSLSLDGMIIADSSPGVEIFDFTATRKENKIILKWGTVFEYNNKGFEVTHSTDGVLFSAIQFVPTLAHGGVSNEILRYDVSVQASPGNRNYYRLRQVDQDGTFKWTPILMVYGAESKEVSVVRIFPNPVGKQASAIISAPDRGVITIIVTDMSGKVVAQKMLEAEKGYTTVMLETENLKRGMYLVKIIQNGVTGADAVKMVKQ